jgi:ATP-binding cassette, subfamily C (CFTR/MRP), member 1
LAVAIFGLQIASLILWTKTAVTGVAVPAAAVALVASLATILLLTIEHNRNLRPSTILQLYLVASLLTGATQIRTLFLRRYVPTIARLQSSVLACQIVFLVLESLPKTRWALPATVPYSPEDFAGIISRTLYFWLNALLLKGNRRILTIDDVSPYVHSSTSSHLNTLMI